MKGHVFLSSNGVFALASSFSLFCWKCLFLPSDRSSLRANYSNTISFLLTLEIILSSERVWGGGVASRRKGGNCRSRHKGGRCVHTGHRGAGRWEGALETRCEETEGNCTRLAQVSVLLLNTTCSSLQETAHAQADNVDSSMKRINSKHAERGGKGLFSKWDSLFRKEIHLN